MVIVTVIAVKRWCALDGDGNDADDGDGFASTRVIGWISLEEWCNDGDEGDAVYWNEQSV